MLKLIRYHFSGIGRFVEKQTVDLENRDHLIQIDGENTNTGGSSGAGKSTIVEALAYLLGISDVPSTNLQSRITKNSIWVQGEFEGGITITRSKKDGLIIETPEETVSGNSKLAEEKLDQIIGVNRNLLKTMCYKRQKQGGFFLNLTPKQSHAFLVECLDLKDFDEKIEKLEENLKNKYKPRKIQLESSLLILTDSVKQLTSLLSQKTKPEQPVLGNVGDLHNNIKNLQEVQNRLIQEKNEKLSQLGSKPQQKAIIFEKENDLIQIKDAIINLDIKMNENYKEKDKAIEQANLAIYTISRKIDEANGFVNKNKELNQELDFLQKQYNHIKEKRCPTCLREWNDDSAKALADLELKMDNISSKMLAYESEINKLPTYNTMLLKAKEMLVSKKEMILNVEEKKLQDELKEKQRILLNEKENIEKTLRQEYLELFNKWNQSFNSIEHEFNDKNNDISNKIKDLKHEVAKIEYQQKSYKEALEAYEKDCRNIEEKLSKSKKDLIDATIELTELDKNVLLSEESIRLIKNFTLQKFQDTLDYIGQRATEIINNIPNMANAVISFENAKETQGGKIKNEVNAVINLESEEEIPIKTLSGGERTSADFAIDLAVSEMIENSTKKGVNFLVIDEGFDGLDSISKIQCLEVLKGLNTDKKILMVDHSSEVKEMVRDIIKVRRVKEESFVQ